MQETTNYRFKKIGLDDSPPDITATNPNWDEADRILKEHEEGIETLNLSIESVSEQLGEKATQSDLNNLSNTVNTKAQFKNGSATFPSGQSTFTITDAFITSNTFVTIIPKGEKQGVWSGVANNGNFVITSDTAETNAVPFDWGGVK